MTKPNMPQNLLAKIATSASNPMYATTRGRDTQTGIEVVVSPKLNDRVHCFSMQFVMNK